MAVAVLTVVALSCVLAPMAAQVARGTLLGRVTDPSSAVVEGGRINALNADTRVHLTSPTNSSGDLLLFAHPKEPE